jgi:hypothetical protein
VSYKLMLAARVSRIYSWMRFYLETRHHMTHLDIRLPILICALAVAVTSSQAQEPAATASPPAAAGTSSAPAAPATPSSPQSSTAVAAAPTTTPLQTEGPSPELLKKARVAGYRPKTKDGVTTFCMKETETGSRLQSKEECIDQDHLQMVIDARQAQHDVLQATKACSGAACGAH